MQIQHPTHSCYSAVKSAVYNKKHMLTENNTNPNCYVDKIEQI